MMGLAEKDLHEISCRTGIASQGEGCNIEHAGGVIYYVSGQRVTRLLKHLQTKEI
jgi:hypothetical protein